MKVREELKQNYDIKPIIIILEENQIEPVLDLIKSENLKMYSGTNYETLQKIRD